VDTTFYVSEGQEIGKLVYNLRDSMGWVDRSYQYSMLDHSSHFAIAPTGEITLDRRIDYEKTPKEKFTVSVFNTDSSVQEYYVNVVADVFDENEHSPTFPHQVSVKVFQSTPQVGQVVLRVNATDNDVDDIGRLEFSLVHEYFTIDKHSGVIRVKRPLSPYDPTTHKRPRPPYSSGVESSYSLAGYPSSSSASADHLSSSHEGRYSVYSLDVSVSDGKHENRHQVTVKVPLEDITQGHRVTGGQGSQLGEGSGGQSSTKYEAISDEKEVPINTRVLQTPNQSNDMSALIIASLQTPEVMIVLGLAGLLLVVVLIACFTVMVCMHRPQGAGAYSGMRPNHRMYYYPNGANGQQQGPPSNTNSQNITQSLYIYGDGGRLNNNRDMRDFMRP